jgi:hypothetical protein
MKRLMFIILVSTFLVSFALATIRKQENPALVRNHRKVATPQLEENLAHECRFWGMIADPLPENVVLDHLANLPNSLKNLGAFNNNGWGLAYYNDTEPVVLRGTLAANTDPDFELSVQQLARANARIGVGHIRLATSGATNIPNPHPFMRCKGGKWWAFGHNGILDKNTLKNLIGEQYLAENPPTVGNNWSDPDVVDSDLYMLYILKCIEEKDWNAIQGITKAVIDISQADFGAMNFFLTDGETLWGFRRGNTLFYYCNATSLQYSAIASQPPTSSQDGWITLQDYNLITLTIGNPPLSIEDITAIPELKPDLILLIFVSSTLLATIIRRKKSTTRIHQKSGFGLPNFRSRHALTNP